MPYEGAFYDIAYFLDGMGASDREFLSAFFLKWVMEERIRTTEAAKKSIFGKVETAFEILREDMDGMAEEEAHIWRMFLSAAGEDLTLDPKEFDRYVRKHTSTFRKDMDALVANSEIRMKKKIFLQRRPDF